MPKPASLSAGLIAKKGEAVPAPVVIQAVNPGPSAAVSQLLPDAPAETAIHLSKGQKGANTNTIAVTVRLDPNRYQALKLYGVKTRTSNQDVLVAALDLYLSAQAK